MAMDVALLGAPASRRRAREAHENRMPARRPRIREGRLAPGSDRNRPAATPWAKMRIAGPGRYALAGGVAPGYSRRMSTAASDIHAAVEALAGAGFRSKTRPRRFRGPTVAAIELPQDAP